MRAPGFFYRAKPSLPAILLAPLGALYGACTGWRMARAGADCGVPVICAGNFTAGGAGKTPMAIEIAHALAQSGETPVFLSRGYGGANRRRALRVDPAHHTPQDVGDEPLLLARVAPVIVCTDRRAGAQAAIAAGASVIVMDDGLQNPDLRKDLSFAVVDGGVGHGNGLCLPAGPLRAPLEVQMPLVDAIVIVGDGAPGDAIAHDSAKPVLRAKLVADPGAASFAGRRFVAFAGIGRPQKFYDTLRAQGAEIVATQAFPDHHYFTRAELDGLARQAADLDARLITTEKDKVRLPEGFSAEVLPVRLVFANLLSFRALLAEALARARLQRDSTL